MHKRASLTVCLVILVLAAACAPPKIAPTSPLPAVTLEPVSAEVKSQLVSANSRFGFRLFAELLKQDAGKNLFISPASVAMALAMTYNGARGETQQAMAKALALEGLSLEDVNLANAHLRAALANPDPKVQLTIANSLWARKGIPFKPDFMQRNRFYYGAEVTNLDFGSPDAPAAINAWVKENTKGRIERIVERTDPQHILFLINAIYFNGTWTQPFDKQMTKPHEFALPDGRKLTVPMMSQEGRYMYYRGQGFQAISLPYGQKRISLYIFLPDQDSSLEQFHQALNPENWERWISEFAEAQGHIALPRFKLEYEAELKDALTALGMGLAFDPAGADLSGICSIDGPVWIDQVKHKTFVEVNEEGTEAAAVTSVAIVASALPGQPFDMVVDRPFFCAIRDNETGTLLFVGSVVEPE